MVSGGIIQNPDHNLNEKTKTALSKQGGFILKS